jgi:heat shock protein HslJ
MSLDDGATAENGPIPVGRTYSVVEIGGIGVLAGTHPVLTFGADGRVSGSATINRVFGPYELDGTALRVGPLASTLMAGLPAAMEQEHRLLAFLGSPLEVRLSGEGSAELVLDDGQSTVRLREGDAGSAF